MLTRILTKPVVTATEISENFHKNYPDFSNKLSSNYSTLSNQCSSLTHKFNEFCPGIYSGLANTKLTIAESYNNGSTYIYSLPTSIGDTVQSYTAMFEPVTYDGSEDREVTRTPPNDNLADNVIALMSDREEIVNHILDLYSCKPTEECFKHYSDDVIFDDPIIYTTGLSNLRAQFYGMYKLFVKSTTISYKILENTPNSMRINLKQRYTLPFVSRAVVQDSEIILEIHEGKITKHIDSWDGKPTGEGGILRKGVAKLVSVFVKVSGN